jgi:hypothetical protein
MPEGDPATNPPAAKDQDESSLLLWLAKRGPKWARIPAVLVGLTVAIVPSLILVGNWATAYRKTLADQSTVAKLELGVSTQLTAERDALGKKLTAALTQDDKAEVSREFDELRHQVDHVSNPIDQAAKWAVFGKKAATDYWGYKVFPSDGCLLVSRVENSFFGSRWIRDPEKYPISSTASIPNGAIPAFQKSFEPKLRPAVYHTGEQQIELQTLERASSGPRLQPVQGGCMNPHPWSYNESWGPYINQCQQPVYRRWNDGCTHVQMYDHCANIWGPIVWQFCAAYHHP